MFSFLLPVPATKRPTALAAEDTLLSLTLRYLLSPGPVVCGWHCSWWLWPSCADGREEAEWVLAPGGATMVIWGIILRSTDQENTIYRVLPGRTLRQLARTRDGVLQYSSYESVLVLLRPPDPLMGRREKIR